jgi:hypothetical protein
MEYKPQKRLLGINNTKMLKSIELGYLTAILHLAPHKLSGVNICPKASVGCAMACLNTSGRGRFEFTQKSRLNKTYYFLKDRKKFLLQLDNEIKNFKKRAIKKGLKPAVRLNGTSDLLFERYPIKDGKNIMELNPDIIFYDYTKIKNRLSVKLPSNYHLTFSKSESNDSEIKELLTTAFNIAVVFNGSLPKTYLGRDVIDGDISDLRFLEPKGVIVGLATKGNAKTDNTGFVVNVN